MLHRTSDLLARLTNYAAVVVGPKAEAVAVRSMQVVALSSTAATVVAVLGNGAVESETIEISPNVTDDQVHAASRHLNTHCSGHPLSWRALPTSGDHAVDAICASALGALVAGSASEHLYMGGTSAMVSAFDAVDIVRDVLRTLEQQFVIVSLVSDVAQPWHVGGDRCRARRPAAVGVLGGRRPCRRRW